MPKQTNIIEGNAQSANINGEVEDNVVSNKIKLKKSEDIMHSMIPIWIHHVSNIGKKVLVYALLDEQLDAFYIKISPKMS